MYFGRDCHCGRESGRFFGHTSMFGTEPQRLNTERDVIGNEAAWFNPWICVFGINNGKTCQNNDISFKMERYRQFCSQITFRGHKLRLFMPWIRVLSTNSVISWRNNDIHYQNRTKSPSLWRNCHLRAQITSIYALGVSLWRVWFAFVRVVLNGEST